MPLNIKIDNFEGPFDFLLHLIKKNEMDIYDIKIYDITNQYLQYLQQMKELDLEITSEFIVIAATLLEIKSKMLLPAVVDDEVSADEERDPRKELVNKLIEYKKFKNIAKYLRNLEQSYGTVYTKKPEIIEEKNKNIDSIDIFSGITMLQLYNMFNDLMNNYYNKMNKENIVQREIPVDAYKIEDKMEYISRKMVSFKSTYFSKFIEECTNKMEVVVTFLALLELIKLKNVKAVQENNFTEIYLERIEDNDKDEYESN
ncbi:ScpA/B protein [Clostridiales bacterium oral taxon 876 str. F0540]|nr:ScpA/B protein [Clostridiales bacterium oral taxon 876 str. F0540]